MEVTIDRLSTGGEGVAREERGVHAGRVLFVPGTAPGDRVLVALEEEHRRYARGRLVEILSPGPGRTEPFCPLFGRCGGCAWQHLASEVQRAARRSFVADALRKIPRGEGAPEIPRTIVHRGERQGFRARARFHVVSGPEGLRVGYHARRARAVVDVPDCPVLEEGLAVAYRELRAELFALAADGHRLRGSVVLTAGDEGGVAVSCRIEGAPEGAVPSGSEVVRRTALVEGRRLCLRVSAEGFAQAHRPVNEALTAELLALWARHARSEDHVVELYAGGGNLTLPLALSGVRLSAVEREGASVADLRENVRSAGREGQVEIVPTDAEGPQTAALLRERRPEVVLLDPPREGARALMETLRAVGPRLVFYVSCDPATLGRDLGLLAEGGYRLRDCVPFDMFPETPHVEALALMVREECPGA